MNTNTFFFTEPQGWYLTFVLIKKRNIVQQKKLKLGFCSIIWTKLMEEKLELVKQRM